MKNAYLKFSDWLVLAVTNLSTIHGILNHQHGHEAVPFKVERKTIPVITLSLLVD